MDKKQDLLLDSITQFYMSDRTNIDKLRDILDGKYASLRLIDWFVTNYAKKKNISYILSGKKGEHEPVLKEENFKVYLNYKSQLKSYSKKQFDPFNRTQRIHFYYDTDKYIVTTICQLNFFRWAIQNRVIDYIATHLDEIDDDMNASVEVSHIQTKGTDWSGVVDADTVAGKRERKKRKELSISATKFLNKNDITILVRFS